MTKIDDTQKRDAHLLKYRIEKLMPILGEILLAKKPAATILDDYYRNNKMMGAKDRRFFSGVIFGILRDYELLSFLIKNAVNVERLIGLISAHLINDEKFDFDALCQSVDPTIVEAIAASIKLHDMHKLPFEAQVNLPTWMTTRLRNVMNDVEIAELGKALNQEASVDLRYNSLATDRESARTLLQKDNIETETCQYSPYCLRVSKRGNLTSTRTFRDGLVEIQDEGSQILTQLAQPKKNDFVVDFCAGAGGKSLLISAIMQNTGKILALDTSAKRLSKATPRIERNKIRNMVTRAIKSEHDPWLSDISEKADCVLVDAPCSGSGTLRRNPDIKLRSIDIEALSRTQKSILDSAAKLVKVGGRLVYATCSVLPDENDEVIVDFLNRRNNFRVISVQSILDALSIPLQMNDDMLRLYPHRHGTDGFFACVMERA